MKTEIVDRARALQHFGEESVMDALMQRFPETVSGTLCRLRAAWLENRGEDLRCHIYQMRGAASWVCADRLLSATEVLMQAYQQQGCAPSLQPQIEALVQELECVNRELTRSPTAEEGPRRPVPPPPETGHAPEAGTSHSGGLESSSSNRRMEAQMGRLEGQLDRLDQQLERHERLMRRGGLLDSSPGLFHSMAQRFPGHFRRSLYALCLVGPRTSSGTHPLRTISAPRSRARPRRELRRPAPMACAGIGWARGSDYETCPT